MVSPRAATVPDVQRPRGRPVVKAVLLDAIRGWDAHRAPSMGAALAFYAASSLGPLLLIAVAITGIVFGRDAAQDRIFDDLRGLLGAPAALVVQQAVEGAAKPASSIIATIIGVLLLLVTASGVFGELHAGMNTIWEVKPPPRSTIWGFVRDRLISFAMVLSLGFILLMSLLLTALLAGVGTWLGGNLPGGAALWQIVSTGISFVVTSLVFALLFRFVPDLKVVWRDAVIAGAVTSGLFTVGRSALAVYFRLTHLGSAYGAAASVIVLLFWVYFFAQIVYFGAELTRALGLEKNQRR